jgi:hypothetical protein
MTIFLAVYFALIAEYLTTQGIVYLLTRSYTRKLKAEWTRIEEDLRKFIPPAPTSGSGDAPHAIN